MPDPRGEEHGGVDELSRLIARDGAVPLSTYMELSNAAYYASRDPFGAGGDFITAPEISQMFGELIGAWCADLWLRAGKPDRCSYVELGPGRGTLAADALRAMGAAGFVGPPHFVETSPILRDRQRARHPGAVFHSELATLPDGGPLLIVANEFFDALPIEQHVAEAGRWRRQLVGRDGDRFVAKLGEPEGDAGRFSDGAIIERSPAAGALMADAAGRVAAQGGALLVIDYGYDEPGTGSTLQAVRDHQPLDPFAAPGEADLTAHVDFAALAAPARDRLLTVHGPVAQGAWLRALGIDARAAALSRSAPSQAADIAAAHRRLTHADAMGALFKVMAAMPIGWPTPEGFAAS